MKKIAIAIAASIIALTPVAAQADGYNYQKRHYNHHHHHNGNNNGAAIVGGLIGGMILGGIIANQNQGYQGYYQPECVTYRYRVYDPYRGAYVMQSHTECR